MVHFPDLPGSPGCFQGNGVSAAIAQIESLAVADATALSEGGVDAIIIENFGDVPFYPDANQAHVVTIMTRIAVKVRGASGKKIGISVLRNDGIAALAIASDAAFIRVNVISGARVNDQGLIRGGAHDLMRYRQQIGAQHVAVMADVQVKHLSPLGAGVPLAQEVDDVCKRFLADAVIVSGSGTGKTMPLEALKVTKSAAGTRPVFIGSGTTASNIAEIACHADGFILGTTFKSGGSLRLQWMSHG